jgi:hypothetical protein
VFGDERTQKGTEDKGDQYDSRDGHVYVVGTNTDMAVLCICLSIGTPYLDILAFYQIAIVIICFNLLGRLFRNQPLIITTVFQQTFDWS